MKSMQLLLSAVSILVVVACSGVTLQVKRSDRANSVDTSSSRSPGFEATGDFLKDVDGLRSIGFDLLMQRLQGQEFQQAVRKAVRDMRTHLIAEATRERSAVVGDLASISCQDGQLNLNYDQIHDQLGMVLQAGILAQLSEQGSKILNSQLTGQSAVIAQLILDELGLRVEGESDVTEGDDGAVITSGRLVIGLKAYQSDSAEQQAQDEKESITISFERVLNEDQTGSFAAKIEVSEAKEGGEIELYEAGIDISRQLSDEGLQLVSSYIHIGLAEASPNYARVVSFEEQQPKVYRIVDHVIAGSEETKSAFVVDLNNQGYCSVEEDELTSEEEQQDIVTTTDSSSSKGDGDYSNDENDSSSNNQDATTNEEEDEDLGEVVHQEEKGAVNKPGQNSSQSPSQN